MKYYLQLFLILIIASSCDNFGIKPGESGDDNNHIRGSSNHTSLPKKLPLIDSIPMDKSYYYVLDKRIPLICGYNISEPFSYKSIMLSIRKPDSILCRNRKINQDFGSDTILAYFGKSSIKAANRKILEANINDRNLEIYTRSVGNHISELETLIKKKIPLKDTIRFIGIEQEYYTFHFNSKGKILKIAYRSNQ